MPQPSSRSDFVDPQALGTREARQIFQKYRIPYVDMTSCVNQVNPAERYVRIHYSPATNVAIARCLLDSIREASRG
jgi:hypothetical protein